MENYREVIRKNIEENAYVSGKDEQIVSTNGNINNSGWLFDFRRIIFEPQMMKAISAVFWEEFANKEPIQVGGLETAAIPMVSAIALEQPPTLSKPTKVFFIRKSRKKDGLMRMIEGSPDDKKVPVILVDDILNSGKSFIRQVEVLEELGYTVSSVWCVLRFRDVEHYQYFHNKNIAIHSLFELNDFTKTLGVTNVTKQKKDRVAMPFTIKWKFASHDPNYFYVVPKSDPIIDEEKIFFGSDSRIFWSLNQKDGSVAWSYKVGRRAKGKSIFSSPALLALAVARSPGQIF